MVTVVSVADELIGGLVAVERAERVIDLTGRKARVRFVSQETFGLLRVCGMDKSRQVTDEVFESFFLILTDGQYTDQVLSIVDFYLSRVSCPKTPEYTALREIVLAAVAQYKSVGGIVSEMDSPTFIFRNLI